MWNRIREIPPFIGALISIIAAVIAAVSWMSGYFATRNQLERLRCITEIQNRIHSKQIQQSILLADKFGSESCIIRLERIEKKGSLTEFEAETLKKEREKYNLNLEKIQNIDEETEKLLDITNSGNIFTLDGKCKEQL